MVEDLYLKKKGRRKPGERVEFVDEIVDAAVTSKSWETGEEEEEAEIERSKTPVENNVV